MSIEQSVVNDVVDVKKALSENWEDILATAAQLEMIMKDGLEKLENPEVLQKFEADLTGITFPDFEFAEQDLEKIFQNISRDLSKYLDPVIAEINAIEEDVSLSELSEKITPILENFGAQFDLPLINEPNISAVLNIVSEVFGDNFSVQMKDLPQGTTNSGSNGTGNLLFDEVGTQFEDLINNHQQEINALITALTSGGKKSLSTFINTNVDQFSTANQYANHNTESFFNSLVPLLANGTTAAAELIKDITSGLSEVVVKLAPLFSDLNTILTTEFEKDSELFSVFAEVVSPSNTNKMPSPSLIGIISVLFALPIELVTKIIGTNLSFDAQVQQSLTQSEEHAYRVYGVMQIVDGFLGGFDALGGLDNNDIRSLLTSLFLDYASGVMNVVAQEYSEPTKSPSSLEIGNWRYQWFVCVALKFASTLLKLTMYVLYYCGPKKGERRTVINLDEWDSAAAGFIEHPADSPTAINISEAQRKHAIIKHSDYADMVLTGIEVAAEIAHWGVFIQLFIDQNGAGDPIKECYILDPIPGIIGGLLNIATTKATQESKSTTALITSISELVLNFAFQFAYGGIYVNTANKNQSAQTTNG